MPAVRSLGPSWRHCCTSDVRQGKPESHQARERESRVRRWDKSEAGRLAESILESLRRESYQALVNRYLDSPEHREVVGESGKRYQVEVEAFWDSGQPGDLRVRVAIDDGGWRALSPLTSDFIIATDGSFVGE